MKRTKERFGKLEMYNTHGISGCKVFDGEDLEYQDRYRLQQLQQKSWIEQQKYEHHLKQQEENEKKDQENSEENQDESQENSENSNEGEEGENDGESKPQDQGENQEGGQNGQEQGEGDTPQGQQITKGSQGEGNESQRPMNTQRQEGLLEALRQQEQETLKKIISQKAKKVRTNTEKDW